MTPPVHHRPHIDFYQAMDSIEGEYRYVGGRGGLGGAPQVGDILMLPEGGRTTRWRVATIEYPYWDPLLIEYWSAVTVRAPAALSLVA